MNSAVERVLSNDLDEGLRYNACGYKNDQYCILCLDACLEYWLMVERIERDRIKLWESAR